MRLPRDLSGPDLAKKLGALGYVVTRQTGSHMRLTRRDVSMQPPREHHVTIPAHSIAGKLILASSSDKDQAFGGTVLAAPCGQGVAGVNCLPPGTNDDHHVFVFTSNAANTSGLTHAFYVAAID